MKKITEYCTGCRACEQLCPKHSIQMIEDEEGFLIAKIDPHTCIDCGLCAKRCPQNRIDLQHEPAQETWAARFKEDNILYRSASGGAFVGLALHVLNQGGIVFGVCWDDTYNAYHRKAENEKELWPLLSSKYVQSDTGHTFSEVKKVLLTGRKVLYSGTGCQIAGLKSFLNREYDNLITVDLICHGVPSPLLFKKYIELLTNKHKAKIEEYDFRDKSGGWGLGYKYKYKCKCKYGISSIDPYYKYFLEGNVYRMCCYACKYAQVERCGDITIGDYWGIEQFHPQFFNTKGVSLVLINSKRGEKLWQEVSSNFYLLQSELKYAMKKNGNLKMPTPLRPEVRAHIYEGIRTLSPERFFANKLPLHPSFIDKLKNLLPMEIKLLLKKTMWKMKYGYTKK